MVGTSDSDRLRAAADPYQWLKNRVSSQWEETLLFSE
jgi:hypothetical protein